MKLIKTIKERHQIARQQSIQEEAHEIIHVSDFDNHLYIAYQNTPLIPIDEKWTPSDIVSKMQSLRQNYVNSKLSKALSQVAIL